MIDMNKVSFLFFFFFLCVRLCLARILEAYFLLTMKTFNISSCSIHSDVIHTHEENKKNKRSCSYPDKDIFSHEKSFILFYFFFLSE